MASILLLNFTAHGSCFPHHCHRLRSCTSGTRGRSIGRLVFFFFFFFLSVVQLQPRRIELAARNFQETSGTATARDRRSPIFENNFWGDGVPQNVRKKRPNFDGGPTYCPQKLICWENFPMLCHVAKVGCSLIQMKT